MSSDNGGNNHHERERDDSSSDDSTTGMVKLANEKEISSLSQPRFSISLGESQYINHYHFLKALHTGGITQHLTTESYRRYLLWLNLLLKLVLRRIRCNKFDTIDNFAIAEDDEMMIVPPQDVAWLWHCHRLSPHKYEKYIHQQCLLSSLSVPTTTTDKEEDPVRVLKDELLKYPKSNPYQVIDIPPLSSRISRMVWKSC